MMRERGMFSNRYMTRKGKENQHNGNEEIDFPLAYTSNKYASKERTPLAQRKKKEQEESNKNEQIKTEQIAKLQKELKDARQNLKRLRGDLQTKQNKHEHTMADISRELQEKNAKINELLTLQKRDEKRLKQAQNMAKKYSETIKEQIYWMLQLFVNIKSGSVSINQVKKSIEMNYGGFHQYIEEFGIQRELQSLVEPSSMAETKASQVKGNASFQRPSQHINVDSIFTEEVEENNLIKIMELQPLIETFNNNQYEVEVNDKIAKKLFSDDSDSPLFKDRGMRIKTNISLAQNSIIESKNISMSKDYENQFLSITAEQVKLPKDVKIVKDMEPNSQEDNFITLKKGQTLRLLRKVREGRWIGQFNEKIGLVMQDYFQF